MSRPSHWPWLAVPLALVPLALVFAPLPSRARPVLDLDLEPHKPVVSEVDLGRGAKMRLVLIKAGTFTMGSPDNENARHVGEVQHRVRISKPFLMGMCEVTRGQFRVFAESAGHENAGWQTVGFDQNDEHPVVNVTWEEAAAFCAWLGSKLAKDVDLPTEAEWEYACRAGTATCYFSGASEASMAGYGNVRDRTFKKAFPNWGAFDFDDGQTYTAPVGRFRPNAWGLYDMIGNAEEWCKDWHDDNYYRTSPAVDPSGPLLGTSRVVRGGSWDSDPWFCRCAYRANRQLIYRSYALGFRVVIRLH